MNELRAICARLAGNELVAAECASLTGGHPNAEGVAVCQSLDLLPRSAYLSIGLRCLAQAASLGELVNQVQALHLNPEKFRIEFLDLSGDGRVSKRGAILALSDALEAYPDLNHPQHRFVCVVQSNCVWLGELLNENDRSYQLHGLKPYHTSSSLPARVARALVNLVAHPAGTILDPFCGTGSILLEARTMGLEALGIDNNPRMVGMSRGNLAHFGYPAAVELGDALTISQTADAIITDLPYGRFLKVDRPAIREALGHLVNLAPRAVYLAENDLCADLEQAGYSEIQVFRVRKHQSMSRCVHICRA
jgi:tRNA G10  N-methylase Trm11